MAYSYGVLAKRYGVSRGAIQKWESRGLERSWTLEQIDEWHLMHQGGRVVVHRPKEAKQPLPASSADKLPADPLPVLPNDEPAAASTSKPTADEVLLAGLGFQETRTMKLRKEIERLSIIIAREKGELVLSSEVRETATRVVSVWCSELDALVGDLPGQLAGLTEADIQPKLRARIELLKANARHSIEAL